MTRNVIISIDPAAVKKDLAEIKSEFANAIALVDKVYREIKGPADAAAAKALREGTSVMRSESDPQHSERMVDQIIVIDRGAITSIK